MEIELQGVPMGDGPRTDGEYRRVKTELQGVQKGHGSPMAKLN